MFALDDIEPAYAGADVNANQIVVFLGDLEAGVSHRFGGSGQGEVDEATHLSGLFFVDEEKRIEVLDLCGETDWMAGEIKGFDLGHTAAASHKAFPDLRGGFADPAEQAKAGDDYATMLHCLLGLLVLFDVVDGILDGLDLLGIFVRDLNVEGFFELHDELDDVEGVCTEIFLKARTRGDFG